ncbi:hypothetical protein Tco_1321000 [Tanacetum coccineum]
MHNNIMTAGSRDRPPMLATGRYAQWRSRSTNILIQDKCDAVRTSKCGKPSKGYNEGESLNIQDVKTNLVLDLSMSPLMMEKPIESYYHKILQEDE